jgi:histidine triad (HIT) family protein
MYPCPFCQIIQGEKPEEIVYEGQHVIVFKDHEPRAPIHLLIVSKAHIPSFSELDDLELILVFCQTAQQLIRELELDKIGYTLGFHGGGHESVAHLHAQLIAGMGNSLVL